MLATITVIACLAVPPAVATMSLDSPATFADVNGEATVESTSSADTPQADYITCGISLTATVVSCTAVHWLCPLSALSAACSCIPLFDKTKNECT